MVPVFVSFICVIFRLFVCLFVRFLFFFFVINELFERSFIAIPLQAKSCVK